jgi:hypothetical protein
MDTIAPAMSAPPVELRHRRVRLALGPGAAAHASGHIRSAIADWTVPVNQAVAMVLTSDLIINAVTNGAGERVTLGIRWSASQFRVEVHDASVSGDSWETAESDADADRGLLLAAALAADWGHYRTPAGRAVYYALAPDPQEVIPSPREDESSYSPTTITRESAASLPSGTGRGLPPRETVSGDGEL